MPVHGIRLDAEFLAIVLTASMVSYFVTGAIISNVMFGVLLAVLFFLLGIHTDIGKLRSNLHRRRELALGLVMVYIVTPMLAFLLAGVTTGGLADALVAIGVSAAAVGSPIVWSNLGRGEGNTALVIGSVSLFTGLGVIPLLLLGFNTSVPLFTLLAENVGVIGIPLLAGLAAQRFDNFLFEDFRHHFSKLALWLLVVVMGVQVQLIYQSSGLAFLSELGSSVFLLTGFVALSFFVSYGTARKIGVMERQARSIGFVSSSKGIGIALFIAAQLSGEAVAYVAIYYFIRQAVCGLIAEYFHHGEFRTLKQLAGLKLPGT